MASRNSWRRPTDAAPAPVSDYFSGYNSSNIVQACPRPETLKKSPPFLRIMFTSGNNSLPDEKFDSMIYLKRRNQSSPYRPKVKIVQARFHGRYLVADLGNFLSEISFPCSDTSIATRIQDKDSLVKICEDWNLSAKIFETFSINRIAFSLDEASRGSKIGNIVIYWQDESDNKKEIAMNIHLHEARENHVPNGSFCDELRTVLNHMEKKFNENIFAVNPLFYWPNNINMGGNLYRPIINPEVKSLKRFVFYARGLYDSLDPCRQRFFNNRPTSFQQARKYLDDLISDMENKGVRIARDSTNEELHKKLRENIELSVRRVYGARFTSPELLFDTLVKNDYVKPKIASICASYLRP